MRSILISMIVLLVSSAESADIPDFKLKDINNRRVTWTEVKGENLTVVDFWATWCKPCIKSIPELIRIHEDFSSDGVAVIGINVDNPGNSAKVKPFSNNMGITYPVLLDANSEVMVSLNVNLLPTLLLVDVNNNIVYRHQGYRKGDEVKIREEIRKLLNTGSSNE